MHDPVLIDQSGCHFSASNNPFPASVPPAHIQFKFGTACHSRWKDLLADNLAFQMCYYNLVRPHSALTFGDETRTPAMQAGLVKKPLSFREIFTAVAFLFLVVFHIFENSGSSREIFVVFGAATTVNEESIQNC